MSDPKKRNGPGRPSKLTPELAEAICARIAKGIRPEVAAAEKGVSPATYYRWMAEGRAAGSGPFADFESEVARARLLGEGALVDTVRAGDERGLSFGPARAALEILSRSNKHYSQKVQVAVETELERIIDVVQRICSPQDFERVLAGIAALDSEEAPGNDPGEEAVRVH